VWNRASCQGEVFFSRSLSLSPFLGPWGVPSMSCGRVLCFEFLGISPGRTRQPLEWPDRATEDTEVTSQSTVGALYSGNCAGALCSRTELKGSLSACGTV